METLTAEQFETFVKFYDWLEEECAIREGVFSDAENAVSFYRAYLAIARATGDTPR